MLHVSRRDGVLWLRSWDRRYKDNGTGTRRTGTAGLGQALQGQRDWDMRNWDSFVMHVL